MNGPLEEQIGSIIVCDEICQGTGLTSGLFSCGVSPPWLMHLPGGGSVTMVFLCGICLQADKRNSVKASPCICCFPSVCSSK